MLGTPNFTPSKLHKLLSIGMFRPPMLNHHHLDARYYSNTPSSESSNSHNSSSIMLDPWSPIKTSWGKFVANKAYVLGTPPLILGTHPCDPMNYIQLPTTNLCYARYQVPVNMLDSTPWNPISLLGIPTTSKHHYSIISATITHVSINKLFLPLG